MKEYKLTINSNAYSVIIKDVTDDAVLAEVNGQQYVVDLESCDNKVLPDSPQEAVQPQPLAAPAQAAAAAAAPGTIPTPLPGQITSINVTVGEKVRFGQKLLVLEAMKMENSITANTDGTVSEILIAVGDVVAQGQPLIVLS